MITCVGIFCIGLAELPCRSLLVHGWLNVFLTGYPFFVIVPPDWLPQTFGQYERGLGTRGVVFVGRRYVGYVERSGYFMSLVASENNIPLLMAKERMIERISRSLRYIGGGMLTCGMICFWRCLKKKDGAKC